jgi:hypothetical protein
MVTVMHFILSVIRFLGDDWVVEALLQQRICRYCINSYDINCHVYVLYSGFAHVFYDGDDVAWPCKCLCG